MHLDGFGGFNRGFLHLNFLEFGYPIGLGITRTPFDSVVISFSALSVTPFEFCFGYKYPLVSEFGFGYSNTQTDPPIAILFGT